MTAVTLRSVSHRTGVPLRSVHRDVGSRDRLVAMMVQHIFSSVMAPRSVVDDDPVVALIDRAEREWEAYVSHPWLVGVLASTRPPLAPAVLDASRAVVEVFVRIGFDNEVALGRYLALSGYIQGMGLLLDAEHHEMVRSGRSYRSWWRDESRRLDAIGATLRHPWLAELIDTAIPDAFDTSAVFRDGLRRIVPALVSGTST